MTWTAADWENIFSNFDFHSCQVRKSLNSSINLRINNVNNESNLVTDIRTSSTWKSQFVSPELRIMWTERESVTLKNDCQVWNTISLTFIRAWISTKVSNLPPNLPLRIKMMTIRNITVSRQWGVQMFKLQSFLLRRK